MHRSSLFAALLLFAIACSNGSSGNNDCPAGAERCACYPNATCDAGLTCLSDRCVRPNGEGGVPGEDASPGQDGSLPDGSTPPDASCGDTSADPNNCGRCGRVCASGTCFEGRCVAYGECFQESDGFTTCDGYCQSRGQTCKARACEGSVTWISWGGDLAACRAGTSPRNGGVTPCNGTLGWGTGTTFWRRCCCAE